MYNVLVCDDEKDIVSALKIYLTSEGYQVFEAYNGREALEIMNRETVHLVLMDIMMPEMDGIQAMVKIREISNVPVILLTAKSEDTDKILGLTVGADDYISKPYNSAELIARVKAQLRRYKMWGNAMPKADEDRLVNGGLVLDKKQRIALIDGQEVRLTAKEYQILLLFMEHPGQVFSSEQIYEHVWNEAADFAVENTVMVHIRHIREKIEIDTKNPRYVKVVWGIGYKMEKYE